MRSKAIVRMMEGRTAAGAQPKTVVIAATFLKAHHTASGLPVKKGLIDRSKDGMNTKLHAVADANGRPLSFFMAAGQSSDHTAPQLCWTICEASQQDAQNPHRRNLPTVDVDARRR